jgi:hypothetical protein
MNYSYLIQLIATIQFAAEPNPKIPGKNEALSSQKNALVIWRHWEPNG